MKKLVFVFFVSIILSLSFTNKVSASEIIPILVKQIDESNESYILHFSELNETLYFVRWAEGSYELWKSDGTSNGTLRVTTLATDSPSNSTFSNATEFNSVLYFSNFDAINGEELWRTDGTEQGTYLVKDINPGISSSMPFAFQNTGNELMFYADDGTHGRELWKTDGTPSGTVLVKDICIGQDGSKQDPFGVMSLELNSGGYKTNMKFGVNDLLYFSAYDCVHGNELWVSDGTTIGTRLVKDINEAGNFKNYNSSYLELAEYNGFMYFSAEDTDGDKELWRTDGTELGTTLVKNISFSNDSNPDNFYVYNNELYFSANNQVNGHELWKTDGSQDGTVLLHDIDPIAQSSPRSLNVLGSELYFIANSNQLWKTNGTDTGLSHVKTWMGNPVSFMITFDQKLFILADDGLNGTELWISDGTTEGTFLSADLNPNGNTDVWSYKVVNDKFFFNPTWGENNSKLMMFSSYIPSPTPTISPTAIPTTLPTPSVSLKITNINAVEVLTNVFAYYHKGNSNIKFKGVTHPLAFLRIEVNSDPKICETTADVDGNFECTFPYIEDGLHTVTITATTVGGEIITYPQMTLGINVSLVDTGNTLFEPPIVGIALMSVGFFVVNSNKLKRKSGK